MASDPSPKASEPIASSVSTPCLTLDESAPPREPIAPARPNTRAELKAACQADRSGRPAIRPPDVARSAAADDLAHATPMAIRNNAPGVVSALADLFAPDPAPAGPSPLPMATPADEALARAHCLATLRAWISETAETDPARALELHAALEAIIGPAPGPRPEPDERIRLHPGSWRHSPRAVPSRSGLGAVADAVARSPREASPDPGPGDLAQLRGVFGSRPDDDDTPAPSQATFGAIYARPGSGLAPSALPPVAGGAPTDDAPPAPGSLWHHPKSDALYRVLGVATCSTNGPGEGVDRAVVYHSLDRREWRYREVGEFTDGRFVPRTGPGAADAPPAPTPAESRRLARIYLTRPEVDALATSHPHRPALLARSGLPGDATLVDAWLDRDLQCFVVVVASAEFTPIRVGDPVPDAREYGIDPSLRMAKGGAR